MGKRPRFIIKALAIAIAANLVAMMAVVIAFEVFDRTNPPPLQELVGISTEVVDTDGKLLRAFVTQKGRWRLATRLDNIDKEYLKLLIAYEDQRFWSHSGIDPRAMIRAAVQFVTNGRIISGGSTITMQLARLLEPRKKRSLSAKLLQMVRAVQIERRLSKKQILQDYLTLAPYGGNLEGIRAASLAYFNKEPKGLSLSEAALLVALPQSPERRRPDRFKKLAQKARDTVLERAAKSGVIVASEVARATETRVSSKRFALPQYAAHLTRRVALANPDQRHHKLTLKRGIQQSLEKVVRNAARRLGPEISIALVLADAQNGNILAEIGSPDFLDARRAGWIDMTRALRSPGSALKPFIYALAFEEGVVKPETLIMDAPADFAGYRPQNFDMNYQGEISVRRALQLSLNVPAVHLLDAVGPARLLSKFRKAGVKASIPRSSQPGLAIGLGGLGITLKDLTQLYTALANGGKSTPLHSEVLDKTVKHPNGHMMLDPVAAWHVGDILIGARPPLGSPALGIAYKTGTSYGYRDAWSIGYDGRHVLGVWVGRADNGSVPGIMGRKTAAPILFEAFAKSGLAISPLKPAPAGALRMENSELPVTLKRFSSPLQNLAAIAVPEPSPRIVYPPEGARIELGHSATGKRFPIVLKLQDGRPPFRWLANGKLLKTSSRKRIATWIPDGSGFSSLTVIDASGRASSVNIYITQ